MPAPRKHLAETWYGGDGPKIVCSCKGWRSDASTTLRQQRLAHRAHRVDMGETVRPLKPTRAERLEAAEAAVARVREMCAFLADRPALAADIAADLVLAALENRAPKEAPGA